MNFTYTQKVAILKSLLYIVDADGIRSIEEKQFLRAFSIDQNTPLEVLLKDVDNISKEEMFDEIHSMDKIAFREVKNLWYICSLSDGIVPEELHTIIDMMRPKVNHTIKSELSREDICYIIDTYDNETEQDLPSQDFLLRYNQLESKLDNRSMEDQYYNNEALLETLELFGFNDESFWYLVLFVKDVVEEKCHSATCCPESVYDTIRGLRDAIDELELHPTCRTYRAHEELPEDAIVRYNNPVTLKLFEKNSTKYKTMSNQAIRMIAHACDHLLKEHTLDYIGDFKPVEVPWTKRMAMFYVVMKRFLEDKEPKTKFTNVSYDKNLLIARVLCAIGWISPEDAAAYSEPYDEKLNHNRKFYNLVKNYKDKLSDGVRYSSLFYQGVKV